MWSKNQAWNQIEMSHEHIHPPENALLPKSNYFPLKGKVCNWSINSHIIFSQWRLYKQRCHWLWTDCGYQELLMNDPLFCWLSWTPALFTSWNDLPRHSEHSLGIWAKSRGACIQRLFFPFLMRCSSFSFFPLFVIFYVYFISHYKLKSKHKASNVVSQSPRQYSSFRIGFSPIWLASQFCTRVCKIWWHLPRTWLWDVWSINGKN